MSSWFMFLLKSGLCVLPPSKFSLHLVAIFLSGMIPPTVMVVHRALNTYISVMNVNRRGIKRP